jgi:hypothetical protein
MHPLPLPKFADDGPCRSYLDGPEGAGKVWRTRRLLVRLEGLYQEIAPPHLGEASSVANYKSRSW